MSLDATRWAWQQDLRPSQKLVLLSLADRAGSENTVWPSYEQICFDTGLDRKTVWGAIKTMAESGLLIDTGERKGVTKQIPVFKLVGVNNRELEKRNGSENGTVPKSKAKGSENGMGNSSENGIRNLPGESTKKQKQYAPPIDGALLSAWMVVRKAKRSGPVSEIAWAGLVREAKAAGISPEDAVRECVERGWVSLKADWIKKEEAPEAKAKGKGQQWWASEKGIEAKGRELGLFPRGGETWNDFKGRINAKLGEVVSYG